MEHEFCPLCGNRCGGVEESTPGDSSVPEDEEVTAAEAVADVAVAALETVAEVVHEHEETDRTAEVADALETMAEESSEVGVAEAVADAGADEPDEHEPEPEVHAESEESGEPEGGPEHEGPEDEPEDEPEEDAAHEEDATPVNAPPQLQEEPEHRAARRSSAPAFRRHRAGARRR